MGKLTVRQGIFETNSSSTHSLTMCSQSDFEKWEVGDYIYDADTGEFIKREDAIAKIEYIFRVDLKGEDEDKINEILEEYEYYSMDMFFDDNYLEVFSSEYTTPKGERIVAFGRFGFN